MPDMEKVIKAIENCIGQPKCRDCPWEDCEIEHEVINDVPYGLMRDALAMLKEQDAEPVDCDMCGQRLQKDSDWIWCPWCGWEMARRKLK